MVLWQSFLVLPQECILVLQWGWWWWGHFRAKSYIRKFFFSFCCISGAELFFLGRRKMVFLLPPRQEALSASALGGLSATSLSFSSSNWQIFFFSIDTNAHSKDWVRCWSAHSKLLIPIYWSCLWRECGVQCHDKYQLRAPAIVTVALNRLVLLWGNVACLVGMLVHACANALSTWVELN